MTPLSHSIKLANEILAKDLHEYKEESAYLRQVSRSLAETVKDLHAQVLQLQGEIADLNKMIDKESGGLRRAE